MNLDTRTALIALVLIISIAIVIVVTVAGGESSAIGALFFVGLLGGIAIWYTR